MTHDASAEGKLFFLNAVGPDRVGGEELAALRSQFCELTQASSAAPGGATFVEATERACDDWFPASIGRFQILSRIGSGSFGCVYLAYDSRLSRNVAIKVSHLGIHSTSHTRARFIREAHAAARLAHPNVVCLHEYGEERGLLYIVYEMCEGPTLEDWLKTQAEPIEISMAVAIVRYLAHGLAHAHSRGLIHRDVKPNNVLLPPSADEHASLPFTPRITDFGLAHDSLAVDQKSMSARLVGTIDFMSPEQARGEAQAITPASDQYSLGIILYRLLTGVLPFAGGDFVSSLQRICCESPRPPRSLRREIPRDLEAIVLTCLNKNPESRFGSCKELARDLERFLRGAPVQARPLRTHERIWRSVSAAPIVSTLIGLIFVGSVACAIVFSLMAGNLKAHQRELQDTLDDLVRSESIAVAARQETEAALEAVTAQKRFAEEQTLYATRQSYRADVHRAYEAWNSRNVMTTVDLLETIRGHADGLLELGFDFKLLDSCAHAAATRLASHGAPATEVKAIPRTHLVVSADHHGRLNFHNVLSGKLEHSLLAEPHTEINSIDIDRQGTRMAVGYSHTIFGLNYAKVHPLNFSKADSWLEEADFTYLSDTTVEALKFSPCSQFLALGPRYASVRIYDLTTNQEVCRHESDSRNRSIAFSPDGQRYLLTSKKHQLLIGDVQTGEISQRIPCEASTQFACWSPCGMWLAYSQFGSAKVQLIAVADPSRAVSLTQPRGTVESLDFSEDGSWLVAGTRRGGVVAWSLAGLEGENLPSELGCVSDVVSHSGEVSAVCVMEGGRVVSASDGGSVVLTSLPNQADCKLGQGVTMAAVAACTAGHVIVQGYRDGRVASVVGDQPPRELAGQRQVPVSALTTSRDARLAAVGWSDGQIMIIDLETGQQHICVYPPPSDSLDERTIKCLSFDNEGQLLAACGDDARLRVWSTADPGHPRWEYTMNSLAFTTCFCGPDRVAVGGMFEQIFVLDATQGVVLNRISGASRTSCLLYDEFHQQLVSGHADGRIRIHAGKEMELRETLNGDAGEIRSLAISPTRDCFFSGDSMGNLKVWNSDHREYVGTLMRIPGGAAIEEICLEPADHQLMLFYADRDFDVNSASDANVRCCILSSR